MALIPIYIRTKLSPLFDFVFLKIYKDSFPKQIFKSNPWRQSFQFHWKYFEIVVYNQTSISAS